MPPHLFDEVKNHLKEMIQVGATPIVHWQVQWFLLERKMDLYNCLSNLRRLNAHTIKDAYSLPHIDETLDCLGGAIIFTSLDLKSGYWQSEMDEESKPLTAFMVFMNVRGCCLASPMPLPLSNV